jgi:hypothetical protein
LVDNEPVQEAQPVLQEVQIVIGGLPTNPVAQLEQVDRLLTGLMHWLQAT